MARYPVSVQEDHLARLLGRPLTGLIELIWNALDADADLVEVELVRNELGGLDAVRVRDDGHGMTADEARSEFVQLGGSWKRMAAASRTKKRSLHGKTGQGRWRAFGIGGEVVRWESVTEDEGRRLLSIVEIARSALREVEISDPTETERPMGTTVVVAGMSDEPKGLTDQEALDKITGTFALHLAKYPIRIVVDGHLIDPSELETRRASLPVPLTSEYGDAELVIVEWSREVDRALYLCDEEGIALGEVHPGVHAPGFSFTAYMRWPGFRPLEADLPLAELDHPVLSPVIEEARGVLRDYLRVRAAELRRSLIEQWKEEDVYPYLEPPADPVQRIEHELFEIVAVTAAPAVNASVDRSSRRLSLELLRSALETRPSAIRRVLAEVLHLSDERIAELDALLDRTSLASIISASKVIVDRLDFLAALEILVFDPETRGKVKERSQLHRILARESWVFGEEFALGADDRSLLEVLQRHRGVLGREELADESQVLFEGKRQIVDLMLWRSMSQARNRLEHLVVELKRPSVKVGSDELTQIKKYAFAVAEDARFDITQVEWDFMIVSTELDAYAAREANQAGKEPGLVYDDRNAHIRVWAFTWGRLIENCRHRLKFVQEMLGYEATDESALGYLHEAHDRFVPENLAGSESAEVRSGRRRRHPEVATPAS